MKKIKITDGLQRKIFKHCNTNIKLFYITATTYLVGFCLFIFSIASLIRYSINSSGHFVWSNLDLIWIFGLILLIVAIFLHVALFIKTKETENEVVRMGVKKIHLKNNFLNKWIQRIYAKKPTTSFFIDLFNLMLWNSSIKKNIIYLEEHKNNLDKQEDKLSNIVEEYYKQMKKNEESN